jgi:hypothetical protein
LNGNFNKNYRLGDEKLCGCTVLNNHDFRKNSSFVPNPAGLDADLTLPPSQYGNPDSRIEDYELKVKINDTTKRLVFWVRPVFVNEL